MPTWRAGPRLLIGASSSSLKAACSRNFRPVSMPVRRSQILHPHRPCDSELLAPSSRMTGSSGVAERIQQSRSGTTQLYDKTIVYNHKRHGEFQLGGRKFVFRMKPRFPRSLTKEFLLVDLVNNLDRLAGAKDEVLKHVMERAAVSNATRLRRAVREYGNERTKKLFKRALTAPELRHAA